ncbi:MAG TPA: YicC/YloC family endoribonuclease [Lacipirellulaceae bacterium]|nr:YicC/YloC family endoribonuclease [Lacipirellulaceae bacterium]
MLISMTGFGEARSQAGDMAVTVEVRTINSRHLKFSLRSSEGYSALEPEVEAVTRDVIRRGTVQLNLRVERGSRVDDYHLNTDVLENYRRQIEQYTGQAAGNDSLAMQMLLSLPGAIDEKSRGEYDPREDWPKIEPVIREALAAVSKMRAEEGVALAADLAHNGRQIAEQLDAIARRAPEVVQSYQSRLTGRVQQALSELNVTVQPADLLREIALFTDRSDISEEIVRLRSHLLQYEAALLMTESSGRKLEFIAQEMGREINTIGSKANDAEISRLVVEIKTALERIREQIQNVE